MLAMDECMGSLEELSQQVDHELDSHFNHADRMQYELEILRAQLAEKNRLVLPFYSPRKILNFYFNYGLYRFQYNNLQSRSFRTHWLLVKGI